MTIASLPPSALAPQARPLCSAQDAHCTARVAELKKPFCCMSDCQFINVKFVQSLLIIIIFKSVRVKSIAYKNVSVQQLASIDGHY